MCIHKHTQGGWNPKNPPKQQEPDTWRSHHLQGSATTWRPWSPTGQNSSNSRADKPVGSRGTFSHNNTTTEEEKQLLTVNTKVSAIRCLFPLIYCKYALKFYWQLIKNVKSKVPFCLFNPDKLKTHQSHFLRGARGRRVSRTVHETVILYVCRMSPSCQLQQINKCLCCRGYSP